MGRDFGLEALEAALPASWNIHQVILSYEEELEKVASTAGAVADVAKSLVGAVSGPSTTGVLNTLRSRAAARASQSSASGGAQKVRELLNQIRSSRPPLQGVVSYEPTMAQAVSKVRPAATQQAARGPGIAQYLGNAVNQAQRLPGRIAAGIQDAGLNFRAGMGGRAPGTQRVLESAQGAVQQQQVARGALATPRGAPVSDPMTYRVPTPQNIQGSGRVRPTPLQQGQVFQQSGTPVVPNPRADVYVPPAGQAAAPQQAPGGYFQNLDVPQLQGQAKTWWANRSGAERAAIIGGLGAAGGMMVGSALD